MKRCLSLLLCLLLLTGVCPLAARADTDWPEGVSIEAESGILIDADTGTVLWGKNVHDQHFPASITKIMTALLVLEKCEMDETVTFSRNAIYNVEVNSTMAGVKVGESFSVKDSLYALLLKSANEVANGLAEHVSGSIEDFAELMNEKARQLGCTDTHFANPSGLNNDNHYTSAYDMALIAKAAFDNPAFVEIDSTTYYVLPPTTADPEGLSISPAHRMVKKNDQYYYPGIIGGKTGYTIKSGNTLVTCAQRNGTRLIAVILKGKTPQYWTDTKNLLDFGFENFRSLKVSDYDATFSEIKNDMEIGGLPPQQPEALVMDDESTIILPNSAEFSDTVPVISYNLTASDPPDAAARIDYTYNGRGVGSTYLKINSLITQPSQVSDPALSSDASPEPESDSATASSQSGGESGETAVQPTSEANRDKATPSDSQGSAKPQAPSNKSLKMPSIVWTILLIVIVIGILTGGGIALKVYLNKREEQARLQRRSQRLQRLKESGYSEDEFKALLEQRRAAKSPDQSSRRLKRKNSKH